MLLRGAKKMTEEVVYGEFGKWVNCEFNGGLVRGWILVNALLCLDVNLLIGYAIYVLSKTGYSRVNLSFKPADSDEFELLLRALSEQRKTPQGMKEWMHFLLNEDIVDTMVTIFGNKEPPEEILERKRDSSRLGILPVPFQLDPDLEIFRGKRADEWRRKMIHYYQVGGRGGPRFTYETDCKDAFLLLDPRIIERNAENFLKEKEIARKLAKKDIYLSPREVAKRYIPDGGERAKLDAEWREIREKAIIELTKDNPNVRLFLLRSMREQKVLDLRRMVTEAEVKVRSRKYKDAIRDCGEIYERVFRLLYEKQFRLREFCKGDKDLVEKDFGHKIVSDFMTVMNLRNQYSHAGDKKPSREEAIIAVNGAGLIVKLFLVKSGGARE